eukprot:6199066-Pleurochrysis_carterae.AAC.3
MFDARGTLHVRQFAWSSSTKIRTQPPSLGSAMIFMQQIADLPYRCHNAVSYDLELGNRCVSLHGTYYFQSLASLRMY